MPTARRVSMALHAPRAKHARERRVVASILAVMISRSVCMQSNGKIGCWRGIGECLSWCSCRPLRGCEVIRPLFDIKLECSPEHGPWRRLYVGPLSTGHTHVRLPSPPKDDPRQHPSTSPADPGDHRSERGEREASRVSPACTFPCATVRASIVLDAHSFWKGRCLHSVLWNRNTAKSRSLAGWLVQGTQQLQNIACLGSLTSTNGVDENKVHASLAPVFP